jgi:hypothetical protein
MDLFTKSGTGQLHAIAGCSFIKKINNGYGLQYVKSVTED